MLCNFLCVSGHFITKILWHFLHDAARRTHPNRNKPTELDTIFEIICHWRRFWVFEREEDIYRKSHLIHVAGKALLLFSIQSTAIPSTHQGILLPAWQRSHSHCQGGGKQVGHNIDLRITSGPADQCLNATSLQNPLRNPKPIRSSQDRLAQVTGHSLVFDFWTVDVRPLGVFHLQLCLLSNLSPLPKFCDLDEEETWK